jgi:hypothetical protein
MFSRKRISQLLHSCKTSDAWTFEDIQVSSVLLTGRDISLDEYKCLPLDSQELLVEYFYNRQPSDMENLFYVFNQLDVEKKGYITHDDLPNNLRDIWWFDALQDQNHRISFREFKKIISN